ncbi:hypothetical protein V8E52_009767 [Russula decolorans]
MRRYKIVACILLILSVFGFVHAVPVAVQEVREACAHAVDRGKNVIIGSGKRAETQEEEGSSSAPNYASGTNPNPSVSSGGEAKSVSFPPSKEVKLPSGLIYSEMLPPETKPLPKMTAQQLPSPPEHQSENIFSKLAGKLKFKFWRRISGTASSVATEGQRDFQGTVDT